MIARVTANGLVVDARGLAKSYGARRVVDEVSFAVAAGECVGLLGPNGAGKTTTIKMVTCFLPRDAGSLSVVGLPMEPRHHRAIKRRLGIVHQEDSLDPDLSVEKNLTIYASYFDVPAARARRRHVEVAGIDREVLLDAEIRVQAVFLMDDAEPPLDGAMMPRLHRQADDGQRARVAWQKARHHLDGGRLAGAVRPQQAHAFARRYREAHLVHDTAGAVALREPACVHHEPVRGHTGDHPGPARPWQPNLLHQWLMTTAWTGGQYSLLLSLIHISEPTRLLSI